MTLVFNSSAFKHKYTVQDVQFATATAMFDELMPKFANKYLLIGFDTKGGIIEVMYNLVDEETANVFHVMKCRKENLKKVEERGHAYFN